MYNTITSTPELEVKYQLIYSSFCWLIGVYWSFFMNRAKNFHGTQKATSTALNFSVSHYFWDAAPYGNVDLQRHPDRILVRHRTSSFPAVELSTMSFQFGDSIPLLLMQRAKRCYISM
jgi:hypothetical protein